MQKGATVQEQARVQAQLPGHIAASCLIEALIADPANTALKQTLKKKQQVQCTKGHQRQANKRKRQWQRRSKKRLDTRKEIFNMAMNMAMRLDISGDKVDTEFPLMPLHTVPSCMFEQRKDIFGIRMRGQEGGA